MIEKQIFESNKAYKYFVLRSKDISRFMKQFLLFISNPLEFYSTYLSYSTRQQLNSFPMLLMFIFFIFVLITILFSVILKIVSSRLLAILSS